MDGILKPILVVNRHGIEINNSHYTTIKYFEKENMYIKFDDRMLS